MYLKGGGRMDLNQAAGGSRVERKKEETRQKIIAAAMDLFRKQGVDATTMEQVAAEADVAKGTLYNHFPAKEAIISAYMQRSFREKKSTRIERFRKMPDTRSRMILLIEELTDGILEYRDIFEKYLVYRMQTMVSVHQDDSVKSGFYLLGAEIIKVGQESGEIRSDVPPFVLRELFEFAFIEVVKQVYLGLDKTSVRPVIEKMVDLIINGARR